MKRELAALCSLLVVVGSAYAHEGKSHGKQPKDAQMAKLHNMMPVYLKAKGRVEAALEKGDVATITKETNRLLATTADLKKSKPHKHLNELQSYQGFAERFEDAVKRTAELARKGDMQGAIMEFASAEAACDECHRKFR